MKIYSTIEVYELEKPFGEPELDISPYFIERVVTNGRVIWFGENINWIKKDDVWYNHKDEEVEEPIYEKLYKEYKNNSFNNLIEGHINGRIL